MNLSHILKIISKQPKIDNFLNFHCKEGWKNISNKEFLQQVKFLTLGLNDLGLQKGEKFGIYLPSSPFWLMQKLLTPG